MTAASDSMSGDEGMGSSPKSRVKFMCSYGGKILPRPGETILKYVGGETRVVAIPRDIKFLELMNKLNAMVEGEMMLKYQVIPDELDALVCVKSDEDLKHMVDEYERVESEGSPKLRAFLFPLSPVVPVESPVPVDPSSAIEQRYIEAINGIDVHIHSSSNNTSGRLTPNSSRPAPHSPYVSSCSSTKSASPDDGIGYLHRLNIQKVQSSPSLYTLHPIPIPAQTNNLGVYHQPHHYYHQYHHHYNQKLPQAVLQYDFGRGPMAMGHGHVPLNHFYPIAGKHNNSSNLGINGCSRCGCSNDDCLVYANGGLIRRCSLPTSTGRFENPGSPGTGNHIWD